MANPLEFEIENLGSIINSEYPDYSPVISVDENALFFTSRRLRSDSSNIEFVDQATGGYFEDIYVSFRDRRGEWQTPEMLGLNTQGHNATMNVSPDGQTLYVYKDDQGDGNIYESRLVGEEWTQPEKMAESINSPHWETHIAVTADGNVLNAELAAVHGRVAMVGDGVNNAPALAQASLVGWEAGTSGG